MAEIHILEVWNEKDCKYWNQIIELHMGNEPMLKAGYYKLFTDSDNRGMAVLYKCDSGIIIYPFMKRAIPGFHDCFDIISAYGYGGPYASSNITAYHWKEFWLLFSDWCSKNEIISEVIKFGLLGNENCFYPGKTETVMNNIVRSLEADSEELYREYAYKVRKNVRRAEKYKLAFEIDKEKKKLDQFLEIYYGTMDRRNADQMYYFDKNFFKIIDSELGDNSCIFFVNYDEMPVSAELVLMSEENMYSYLGGTNPDYFEMRPNDYLKVKMIEWGHENGYKNYILGGGHGSEDGIYRYKKSFAPNGIKEFKIGSRIIDDVKYRQICDQKGVDADNDFIPAYRAVQ